MSFLDESYKSAIALYGTKSGRDIDKEAATGLHLEKDQHSTFIQEAKLVIECKKMYKGRFSKEEIIDDSVFTCYPENDFHYVYIGEITRVLVHE